MLSGTVKLLITLGSLKIPTEISISFTSGKFSTIVVRNLYAGQEATVRTAHGKTEWFQIGKKEYIKAVYCHPAYLTSMQSVS